MLDLINLQWNRNVFFHTRIYQSLLRYRKSFVWKRYFKAYYLSNCISLLYEIKGIPGRQRVSNIHVLLACFWMNKSKTEMFFNFYLTSIIGLYGINRLHIWLQRLWGKGDKFIACLLIYWMSVFGPCKWATDKLSLY